MSRCMLSLRCLVPRFCLSRVHPLHLCSSLIQRHTLTSPVSYLPSYFNRASHFHVPVDIAPTRRMCVDDRCACVLQARAAHNQHRGIQRFSTQQSNKQTHTRSFLRSIILLVGGMSVCCVVGYHLLFVPDSQLDEEERAMNLHEQSSHNPARDVPYLIKQHLDCSSVFGRVLLYIRLFTRGVCLSVVWFPLLFCYPFLPERVWLNALTWLCEQSGPVFIKLAQWAATRPDLFPLHVCKAFSRLQSCVEPHSYAASMDACKNSFGNSLQLGDTKLFVFEDVIGSGSMGQVHYGILRTMIDDESPRSHDQSPASADKRQYEDVEVAVKILHPNIHSIVSDDLTLLYLLGVFVHSLPIPGIEWLSIPDSVIQFSSFMANHLDLKKEAQNMSTFRKKFKNSCNVEFACPMYPFVSDQVLVQELKHGFPLHHIVMDKQYMIDHALSTAHAASQPRDPTLPSFIRTSSFHFITSPLHAALADLGLHMYLQMLIDDNFVHSDLHPGNMLVSLQSCCSHGGVPSTPHYDELSGSTPVDTGKLKDEHLDIQYLQHLNKVAKHKPQDIGLIILDCGLVTQLSKRNRRNFLSLFGALIQRDGHLAARLMLSNARASECADPVALGEDMHAVVSQIPFDRIGSVDLGQLLNEVMNVVRQHHVKLESDFASLVISLMIVEGIGRVLDPDLSLFQQSVPVILRNREARSIVLRNSGWPALWQLAQGQYQEFKRNKNQAIQQHSKIQ